VAEPTKRQLHVLRFIADHTAANTIPPSRREICHFMGVTSLNAVHGHLMGLEHRGLLVTGYAPGNGVKGLARNLVITDAGWASLGRATPHSRDVELAKVRSELTAALLVIEEAVNMRTRLRAVDGSGEATIYFSAALADFNKLRGVPCG
jgi:SOS-response transcriptional repressor LexA